MAEPIEAEMRLYQLRSAISATAECFGEEASKALVASQGPAFAEAIAPVATSMSWVPTHHMIDWSLAVWEQLAKRDRGAMVKCTQRQVDLGFGRLRRALVSIATPGMLLSRAPELWDKDNRGGRVTVDVSEKEGVWTLVDHPYCDIPHARLSMAEVLRYCLELTRGRDVTESHGLDSGRLWVRLRWR